MKFEMSLRSILGLNLEEVSKAVSNKNINYSMIKLTVKDNNLVMEAINQTLRIKATINSDYLFGSVDGQALVDGRLLLNIVKKTEGEKIKLRDDETKIYIESGKSRFGLNKLSNQFPEQSDQTWDLSLLVNAEILKQMISKVEGVVSENNQKAVLQGINIKTVNNQLFMYATDGYRGAVTNINIEKLVKEEVNSKINIIVPGQDLAAISKSFGNGEVQVSLNKQYISFIYKNVRYDIRLLEGEFPKMEKLFETEGASKVIVDKKKLISAVDRASIIIDDYPALKFEFRYVAEGELIISTIRSQIGKAVETIDIDNVDKLEMKIGVSYKFILDALKTYRIYEVEKLIIHIFSNTRAIVITSTNPEESLRHIVYPILLAEGD